MSDHGWCRDVQRDEAIRAAEDAAAVPSIQHRDLPEQVALLWASVGDIIGRVVRLEGEMDAGQDEAVAQGVTLRERTPGEAAAYANGMAATVVADLMRERDAARAECERLSQWVPLLASMEVARLKARVAELEGAAKLAPDRNAGGGSNHPVAWLHEELGSCFLYPNDELKSKCVPLYAAPQPPRGWLTAEMRDDLDEALEWLNCQTNVFAKRAAAAIATTLARETPPRVRRPNPNVVITTVDARERIDRQWIAAIRAAGGEVE